MPAENLLSRIIKGAEGFKTATIAMTAEASGAKTESTGAIDQSNPAKPKMKLTLTAGAQKMEMILVDGVTYVQSPGSGGKYVKSSNPVPGADQFSPAAQAEKWKSMVKTVTLVGRETVNGAETDHFRFTIDAEGAPINMDLWLDSKDRPVQSKMTFSGGSTTISYSNFDAPVDISAPPASQIQG